MENGKMGTYCGWEAKSLIIVSFYQQTKKKTLYYNNEKKATIFIEYFFPLLIKVDLSNILDFIYLELRIIKEEVKEEDIIAALKGLIFNKTLN